ncbi:MAG TPA: MFS transporter [Chloroflexia bacterium]|nr:MFS transporter [Chloroflexia bacterium]
MPNTAVDPRPDLQSSAESAPADLASPAPPASAPGGAAMRGARDFWLVWSGQSVSLMGDGLYGIAMAWWITQALGSATALAGYALCWFVPAVTMPFIAGSLIDRANRKLLIAVMDGAQGLAVTTLAILLASSNLQLWHVYIGAVILSACSAIHGPALDSTIPNLVPEAALSRANGLYATSQSVSNIAGPLFGGTLVGIVGLPVTMLINAVSFWVATIATLLARVPSPRVQDGGEHGAFARLVHDATYGYKWIWAHRPILYLLLIFTTGNFLIAPTYPLESLVIKNQLLVSGAAFGMTGALILGVLSAMQAVGALVSAVFFSRGYAVKPMAWGVCLGWAVNGLAAVGFGLSSSVVVAITMAFFLGAAGPICNIPSQTIWMSYTPDAERGRIFSARRTIAWGIQPISIALGGLLAERIGVGALYVGAGSIIVLVALGNLAFNRTIRALYAPDLAPDAAHRGLIYRR